MRPQNAPTFEEAAATTHRRFLGRYAVLATLDLGAKACGFLVTVTVARHFGAASFGALGLAQQITAYGLMASTLGLDMQAVKTVLRSSEPIGSIASTVVALRLVLGTLCYLSILAVLGLVPLPADLILLLAFYGLTFYSGAASVAWLAQAKQRTDVYGMAQLGTQGVFAVLVLIAVSRDLGIWSVPLALVIAEAAAAAAVAGWSWRHVDRLRRPLAAVRALRLLRRAAPIGGAQILRALAMGSDIVLLGLLADLTVVGWYSGAHRIYLLGSSLTAVYFVVLYPHLARRGAGPRAELHREIRRSLARVLPVAAVVLGVGAWGAGAVLGILYGPSFATAATALQVLLAAVLIALVNGHLRHALIVTERQRVDLRNVAASSLVHVVFKLALIPILGLTGAALGTLIGETTLLVLGSLSVARRDGDC